VFWLLAAARTDTSTNIVVEKFLHNRTVLGSAAKMGKGDPPF
jgi:hypothetical protein